MAPVKVILLACGSFNPPTNMHLRMFEVARDHLHRLGTHVVIGGIISPVHDSYGKKELVTSTHRLAMIRLALQTTDWIKVSDWECQQESWSRTRKTLQHFQNHVNSLLTQSDELDNGNGNNFLWMPDSVNTDCSGPVQVKLLCGGDLLESFGTPGLWADEDIEAIVGQHGLVVVTRDQSNPLQFIYESDLLTRLMGNIIIVTEWIKNDVSSSKIRRALRRSESIKYLIPDKVIDYVYKHGLYGAKDTEYIISPISLTPSPLDHESMMESPDSNNFNPCLSLCNTKLFSSTENVRMYIDTVDSKNAINSMKRPGQAVKVVVEESGKTQVKEREVVKQGKEVCTEKGMVGRVRLPKVHSKKLRRSLRTAWQRCNNVFDWGALGGQYHC